LEPFQIVLFLNHWITKNFDHATVVENLGLSLRSSIDWRSFCSEVAIFDLGQQGQIGGPGVVVEIDETCVARCKYNRGRPLSHLWLFGGVERVSKKLFIIPLDGVHSISTHRTKDTLLPLIQTYIKPGSVIMSDMWKAYDTLGECGYTHHRVNHKHYFVHPEDPAIHTQNIERVWRDVKEWIKKPGIRPDYIYQYLARYLFVKKHNTSDCEVFHNFWQAAAALYTPQGCKKKPSVRETEEDVLDQEESLFECVDSENSS
jgi:hypothetical protein